MCAPLSRKPLDAAVERRRILHTFFATTLVLAACTHRPICYAFHVSGVVVDQDGVPILGARVTLEVPITGRQPNPPVTHGLALTDTRGEFGFDADGLIELHSLRVEKEGYGSVSVDGNSVSKTHHVVLGNAAK